MILQTAAIIIFFFKNTSKTLHFALNEILK